MLVLSRNVEETIHIRNKQTGDMTLLKVVRVDRGRVRLGFEAPEHIEILRTKLIEDKAVPQSSMTTVANASGRCRASD